MRGGGTTLGDRGRWLALACVVTTACATLASEGAGDRDLPTAGSGPFRALKRGQTCDGDVCTGVNEIPAGASDGTIKYFDNVPLRAPAVILRGAGGDDLRMVMYGARDRGDPPYGIERMESADARTFTRDKDDVVTADRPFEGGRVGDPWALDVPRAGGGSEVWLYYSITVDPAAPPPSGQIPGIARARSTDGNIGRAFVKDAAPLLTASGNRGRWETTPPRAPSVVRLDDGTFRMFYAAGDAIGEAVSTDGARFVRRDADPSTPEIDPVFSPAAVVDPATLPPRVKPPFDDRSVDDPCVDRTVTPAGRVLYRMLYTGRDRRKGSAIGYAGRYGDEGTFDRGPGEVFGGKLHANAPAIARFAGFSLLFADRDTAPPAQAIGIAVSPPKVRLPLPDGM